MRRNIKNKSQIILHIPHSPSLAECSLDFIIWVKVRGVPINMTYNCNSYRVGTLFLISVKSNGIYYEVIISFVKI